MDLSYEWTRPAETCSEEEVTYSFNDEDAPSVAEELEMKETVSDDEDAPSVTEELVNEMEEIGRYAAVTSEDDVD